MFASCLLRVGYALCMLHICLMFVRCLLDRVNRVSESRGVVGKKQARQKVTNFRQRRLGVLKISILLRSFSKMGVFSPKLSIFKRKFSDN